MMDFSWRCMSGHPTHRRYYHQDHHRTCKSSRTKNKQARLDFAAAVFSTETHSVCIGSCFSITGYNTNKHRSQMGDGKMASVLHAHGIEDKNVLGNTGVGFDMDASAMYELDLDVPLQHNRRDANGA